MNEYNRNYLPFVGCWPLRVMLLVLVSIKLIGIIDWSWWLVLVPIWANIIIAVVVVGVHLFRGRR